MRKNLGEELSVEEEQRLQHRMLYSTERLYSRNCPYLWTRVTSAALPTGGKVGGAMAAAFPVSLLMGFFMINMV